MGPEKKTIDDHAAMLKKRFAGRGWFVPRDTHRQLGLGLRELCGALRCADLHGIPGCTILHDKESKPPRWIIINGTAPEEIQRDLAMNKPKKRDWSFLTKPWPLWDLLNSLEDDYDSVRSGY